MRLRSTPIDVLVVCTGNICRSPMAEGLLRAELQRAGVDATVQSVGLVTRDRPASEHGVDAMARRGIDIGAHRSRILGREHVAGADLILCMELHHLREVVVLEPEAFPRTFTLPELARRAPELGVRPPDQPVADWLAEAGAGRRPSQMLGRRPADEVADPLGGSPDDYEATARELEGLVATVVAHLFPNHDGGRSCE